MTAPQLVAGQVVAGKYAVQTVLQPGGVVATYHAIGAPRREVALRLYDASLKASFDLMGMLRHQESATNRLPGSLVNHILETGEDPEPGFVFSVSEFITHPSLAQLVELCPLSPADSVVLVRSLARVMDLAHSSKLAHLGLKPTNLFVGPAPGYEVRLTDFGVNALRTSRLAVDPLGPWAAWIAPEQAVGAGGPAADVFSAALIAFYAMTGRSFWRSQQRGGFDPSAWEAERRRPRTPISARSVECGLSLPQTLDAAFTRALCDAPGERFPSVGAFADALASAIEVRPGQTPARSGASAGAGRGAQPRAARPQAHTLIGIPGPNNPFAPQQGPDTPTKVRIVRPEKHKSGAPLQALSATTFSAPAPPAVPAHVRSPNARVPPSPPAQTPLPQPPVQAPPAAQSPIQAPPAPPPPVQAPQAPHQPAPHGQFATTVAYQPPIQAPPAPQSPIQAPPAPQSSLQGPTTAQSPLQGPATAHPQPPIQAPPAPQSPLRAAVAAQPPTASSTGPQHQATAPAAAPQPPAGGGARPTLARTVLDPQTVQVRALGATPSSGPSLGSTVLAGPGQAMPFASGPDTLGATLPLAPPLPAAAGGRPVDIAAAYGLSDQSVGATLDLGSQQPQFGQTPPPAHPARPFGSPQPPQAGTAAPSLGPSPLAHMVAEAASAAAGIADQAAATTPLVASPALEPLLSARSEAPTLPTGPRWLIPVIVASVLVVGGLVVAGVLFLLRGSSASQQREAQASSASSSASAAASASPSPSPSSEVPSKPSGTAAQPEPPAPLVPKATTDTPEAPAASEGPKGQSAPSPSEVPAVAPSEPSAKPQEPPIAPPPHSPSPALTGGQGESSGAAAKKPTSTAPAPAGAPKKPCGKFLKRCQ